MSAVIEMWATDRVEAPHLNVETVVPESMEHGWDGLGGFSLIFFGFIRVDPSDPYHPCSINC
jgi:hypothetical protein